MMMTIDFAFLCLLPYPVHPSTTREGALLALGTTRAATWTLWRIEIVSSFSPPQSQPLFDLLHWTKYSAYTLQLYLDLEGIKWRTRSLNSWERMSRSWERDWVRTCQVSRLVYSGTLRWSFEFLRQRAVTLSRNGDTWTTWLTSTNLHLSSPLFRTFSRS